MKHVKEKRTRKGNQKMEGKERARDGKKKSQTEWLKKKGKWKAKWKRKKGKRKRKWKEKWKGKGKGRRNRNGRGDRRRRRRRNKWRTKKKQNKVPQAKLGGWRRSLQDCQTEKTENHPLDLEVRLGVLIPGRESALAAWHVLAFSPPLVPCPVEILKTRAWGGKHWISELVLKWAIWDLRWCLWHVYACWT